MLYCLRLAESMGIEDKDEDDSSCDGNNENAEHEESDGSDSGSDAEEDMQFRDSLKLVKFNTEQKQKLKEMWLSLRLKEEEKEQAQKMMALSVSFILQSLKGVDQFDSPMVHFAAVLGIDEEAIRLRKDEECSLRKIEKEVLKTPLTTYDIRKAIWLINSHLQTGYSRLCMPIFNLLHNNQSHSSHWWTTRIYQTRKKEKTTREKTQCYR